MCFYKTLLEETLTCDSCTYLLFDSECFCSILWVPEPQHLLKTSLSEEKVGGLANDLFHLVHSKTHFIPTHTHMHIIITVNEQESVLVTPVENRSTCGYSMAQRQQNIPFIQGHSAFNTRHELYTKKKHLSLCISLEGRGISGPTLNHSNVALLWLCWQTWTSPGGLPDSVNMLSHSFVSDFKPRQR